MNKVVLVSVIVVLLLVVFFMVMQEGKKEVYLITSLSGGYDITFEDAKKIVKTFDSNAELATYDQVVASQKAGSQWCSNGWMADGKSGFPMQGVFPGCGEANVNIWGADTKKANIIAYGVKPSEKEMQQMRIDKKVPYWIMPFFQPSSATDKARKWSQYD